MDVMEIRRMLLAMGVTDMGAEVIKGSFTTPSGVSQFKLGFGKSFSRYLFLVEMTNESKTALLATGNTSNKMYCCEGMYPTPVINNQLPDFCMMSYRVVPSTGVPSYSASVITGIDSSSITFNNNTIGSGTNVLYQGYSYNYIIVSLDNV